MRVSSPQALALKLRGNARQSEPSRPTNADASERAHGSESKRLWPALVACLALSALTLLLPATPTYDPWAWIMWGREIVDLDLVTEGGPSWKPLPVLFTMPFSLFGDEIAPLLWLWVARAGGLLSLVMAYRMGRRLTGGGIPGALAGFVGAAFLATTYNYARDAALGNSEPLLAAFALWGFERHLDGRRDHALYLGFAAALLRPEVWPFLGIYGLWLMVREPALRARVVAVGVLIPLLWFGPEIWGSGDALRASTRANDPNPQSAAFADNPGLEVAHRFQERTIWPILAGAALALILAIVAFARRRAQGPVLFLAAAGLSWLVLVAVMTQFGYAGNQRYLIVTTAALCALGGVGVGSLFQALRAGATRVVGGRPRLGLAAAAGIFLLGSLALIPAIRDKVDNTERVVEKLDYEASLWDDLPGAIEAAGGRDRVLSCGSVYTGPFQTQMVAYVLGVHGLDVADARLGTPAPGLALRTNTTPAFPLTPVDDDRFREVATNGRWRVETAPRSDARGRGCPAAGADAPRVPPTRVTPDLVSSR
jgi:hypothetical protein